MPCIRRFIQANYQQLMYMFGQLVELVQFNIDIKM